jgi:hypothetical protein
MKDSKQMANKPVELTRLRPAWAGLRRGKPVCSSLVFEKDRADSAPIRAAAHFHVMHKISIMKNILLTTLFIIALSSCGTLKISEVDRKLVSEGKKSLLVTQNFNLLGRVTRKIILDIL